MNEVPTPKRYLIVNEEGIPEQDKDGYYTVIDEQGKIIGKAFLSGFTFDNFDNKIQDETIMVPLTIKMIGPRDE